MAASIATRRWCALNRTNPLHQVSLHSTPAKMATSKLDSTGEIDYSDSFEVEEEEVESVNSSTVSTGRQKALKQTVDIPKASILMTVSNHITRTGVETGAVSQSTSKAATERVRMAASATHTFTDSLQMRDAVFSEWRSRKETRTRREKSEKAEAGRREVQEKRKREVEMVEKSVRVVEKWSTAKEKELLEKQKHKKREEARQKKLEVQKEEKREVSEIASKKWREEMTKQLVVEQRERRRKVQKEEERKREEAAEKVRSSEQAFKVWSQRKSEAQKEGRHKQKQQTKEQEGKKREVAVQRQHESKTAFDAWKTKKDDHIRRTGKLYTYGSKPSQHVHPMAWCPARSMQYSYPGKEKTARLSSTGSIRSASTASVRSEASSVVSGGTSRPVSPNKGRPKNIQVCCQTLEYWCTCEDH